MPLDFEWMPDEVFPTSVHFLLAPRGHPAKGTTLGIETSTCLSVPSQFVEFRKGARLHEVPPDRLFLRDTVVVTVPRAGSEEIDGAAVEAALGDADFRQGDALLLRTGWGDRAGEMRGTDRYVLETPHLTTEADQRLGELMGAHESDLLLTDAALVGLPD